MTTWAVCRLYLLTWVSRALALPQHLLLTSWLLQMTYDVYFTLKDGNMPAFVGMLGTLECLHIYWYAVSVQAKTHAN